jgi:hypothetical protein
MNKKQGNVEPGAARTILAVTIRQPQAAAVLAGAGPYEFPGWRTDHRGPLLIHAAKRGPGDAPAGRADSPVFGALIGVVHLADCVTTDRAGGGPDEVGYAWVLESPRAFPVPIPYVGRLGLFNVPVEAVAEAMARLRPPVG